MEQVQIHSNINFNPRGLYENSGVCQWFNERLIAIQEPTTARDKYRVMELPPQSPISSEVTSHGRKVRFEARYQAEYWIDHNFSAAVIMVTPEDIAEEIERRKVILAQEQEAGE